MLVSDGGGLKDVERAIDDMSTGQHVFNLGSDKSKDMWALRLV